MRRSRAIRRAKVGPLLLLSLLTLLIAGAPGLAARPMRPALILSNIGRPDPYNAAALSGFLKAVKPFDVPFRYYEPARVGTSLEDMLTIVRRIARAGFEPIILVGNQNVAVTETLAPEFPDTRFAILDAVVAGPNVRSVLFGDEEGAYLAGMAAASVTKSAVLGFIGGLDVPVIRRFECGFIQGARSVRPDVVVYSLFDPPSPIAFNNPRAGVLMALRLVDAGADVIFPAAGTTGVVALATTVDAGRLAIGVDVNENGIYPGHVLTSVEKHLDIAIVRLLADYRTGDWRGGSIDRLGLKDGGVGLSFDRSNEALISSETRERLDRARRDMEAGKPGFEPVGADGRCPVARSSPP